MTVHQVSESQGCVRVCVWGGGGALWVRPLDVNANVPDPLAVHPVHTLAPRFCNRARTWPICWIVQCGMSWDCWCHSLNEALEVQLGGDQPAGARVLPPAPPPPCRRAARRTNWRPQEA